MPKNATLGTNLVDSLVTDVIDALRDELHADFGVRAYEVSLVTRTWSEGEIGAGTFTDAEEILNPRPLVEPWRIELGLEPCGLDESGMATLREVSLAYTHQDLLACEAPAGTEYLYKISDGHGQDNPPRYFVHAKAPFIDRVNDMAWIVYLQHVETECP